MIPELGQLALWVALAIGLVLGTLPLAGAQRGRADWMALARPLAAAQALAIIAAFALLTASFVRFFFPARRLAARASPVASAAPCSALRRCSLARERLVRRDVVVRAQGIRRPLMSLGVFIGFLS